VQETGQDIAQDIGPLAAPGLGAGIRARFLDPVNGLRLHILEAGYETPGRPLLVLLHGFPELAYSWRKVMRPLAEAGFHVVAPDQRGYGRTTGWSPAYDQELAPFSMLHLAGDAAALVYALGYAQAAAVIGHDFGSPVAAWCALARPDVFRKVVMMSSPFAGTPAPMVPGAAVATGLHASKEAVARGLASLPRPRKHYQWYYSEREADADMRNAPQGLHAFLRAYFHFKSADYAENRPHRLPSAAPEHLAVMPTYYIMDRDADMAATVAPYMPSPQAIAACGWMSEAEMAVYAQEFGRTGFQGGLNWYRTRFDAGIAADQRLYAGKTIDIPAMFVAGASDWGIYQVPGAVEAMQETACTRMQGCHFVSGAGHWVMQEQPDAVVRLFLDFLR
jgi:pimeloyl-ACP methyl ester carboxylesterase